MNTNEREWFRVMEKKYFCDKYQEIIKTRYGKDGRGI